MGLGLSLSSKKFSNKLKNCEHRSRASAPMVVIHPAERILRALDNFDKVRSKLWNI